MAYVVEKCTQLLQTGIVSVREEQAVRKRGMANTSHVGPLDLNERDRLIIHFLYYSVETKNPVNMINM